MIISLIGVQLARATAWSSSLPLNRGYMIEQRGQRHTVIHVGAGEKNCQRRPSAIRQKVSFGARASPIRRIWADGRSPFLADRVALSMQARDQSRRSASYSCCKSVRCSCSHTPACCQSRNRRQQVTPEPHPISCGSMRQGMPDRRTKIMPVKAARLDIGGRPPRESMVGSGNRGSTMAHNSSETIFDVMLPSYKRDGLFSRF